MQVNRPGHCRTFENGQSVIMRDYCGQNKRVPGIICKPTGPVSYGQEYNGGGMFTKCMILLFCKKHKLVRYHH